MFRLKLALRWGHTAARARASLFLGHLHDYALAPSSSGGRDIGQAASDVDEEAAFDHFHLFHTHNGRNA